MVSLPKGPNGTSNSVELEECIQNPGFREDGSASVTEMPTATGGDKRDSAGADVRSDAAEYTQVKPYAGMPKEVLLLYSGQARYRVPRQILFWLTVLCTLVLVALTITVIALSPRCLSWWQASPIYQVYPLSFRDNSGDGIGDLQGIKEKLDHVEYLNIKAIWIGPVYKSPMKDFGYDVEDFRDIDPIFGTMQDFDDLLAEIHNKGLKLIMDFIPNHTSNKHHWFNQSRAGDEHYKDYYVWTDCNDTNHKPNNWVSVFGNSSWTYDEARGQCYLHQFLKEQPDLNFRDPHVRKEMIDLIQFWMGKGVDGFRMDAVQHILEAKHLRDEPLVNPNQTADTWWDLHHDYTTSQLGLHDLLREWRAEMDIYSREPGRYRFMVSESYDYQEVENTMMYYGTPQVKESDFPFNFYLMDLPQNTSGWWAKRLVHLWMDNMPSGQWPNWVVGNHDRPRIASSAGQRYTRVINMLLLTLPGTPTTYYGEEIGMENVNISESQIQDPAGKFNTSASRDPQRSPMQWTNGPTAGFNKVNNHTWMDVHPDHITVNVEAQKYNESSVLEQYRSLSALRQSELSLHRGWFCYVHADANVFSYLRELDGHRRAFLIVLNFGSGSATTDLSRFHDLPDQLKIRMSTRQAGDAGEVIAKSNITTAAGEGLLIEFSSGTRFNPSHPTECYISEKACYLGALDILYKC